MPEQLAPIAEALRALSVWEAVAVALAIAYLVLAVRQNIWCWAAAFTSTGIYLVLFYRASLFMESALQIFYLAMAVYGYLQWRHHSDPSKDLTVSTWPVRYHLTAVVLILVATTATGVLLEKNTTAALPYLDAFTTFSAMVTTYMVAKKILENWVYWFVIDSVSIYLYVNRELYLTALLFGLYLVLIVIGFISWKRDYDASRLNAAPEAA